MSVTLGNLGTTTLVGTPGSTTLAVKGLATNKNITFSTSSTDITLSYNTPACRLRVSSPSTLANASSAVFSYDTEVYDPTNMHDNMTNPERVTIATAGLYYISFNLAFGGTAPGGYTFVRIWKSTGSNTNIASESFWLANTGGNYIANVSTVNYFDVGNYIFTDWQNSTGVTLTPAAASDYTPSLSVCRVGDN